ncbi:MAG: tRNA (guanosine(37)-N1)-methyltransferase TrmD [Oscillospiraceae bacterium]
MRIDIATLFPDMCDGVLHESIIGRGIKNGFIEIYSHDIRKYSQDKHRRVDDKPYGGGTGMVMQAQPVYDCIMDIVRQHSCKPRIIYMSPQGQTLTQSKVAELAAEQGLILLCGHYEGIDQRVLDELSCEELSVGDYVLTGGELPALIVADAVARLQPGVLPNEDAYSIESHYNGLLEYPQYTMPREWMGRQVPRVLTTGDHRVIAEWQRREALRVTAAKRPDMHRAYLDRAVEEFWQKFLSAKGLPQDTEYAEVFRFEMSECRANELLRLVMRGKKRATSSSLAAYDTEGDKLPVRGQYSIVTDRDGVPRCVIRTTAVRVLPFREVTFELASKEGEDASLEDWQRSHEEFFSEEGKELGYEFTWDMPVIFQEFRLEYKGSKVEQ